MSDLIDFVSPSTEKTSPAMTSPLIPAPENVRSDATSSVNEAGPLLLGISDDKARRSMENNPFDLVLKKITDYERNKEDPFERVAMGVISGRVSMETKDDLLMMPRRRQSDVFKRNKTLDEIETDMSMSIITDLNDTNLIECNAADGKKVVESWNCDSKPVVPNVNISTAECDLNLSILNTSNLNDSLLEHKDEELLTRPRSMSQSNFLMPTEVSKSYRRSVSVTDTMKNSGFSEDSTMNSVKCSMFEEPLNNAFRQISFRSSNTSSNTSNLSSQSERLNSDSSVFSGVSNLSAIPMDSSNKTKRERFCSDSSVFSGTSNISIIPPNGTASSCDSSVFSNDTINKGFVTSRSLLSSASFTSTLSKTPMKSDDKADLLKKFYAIKTRMSSSQMDLHKCDDNFNGEISEPLTKTESNIECSQNSDDKLVDIDSGINSVSSNDTAVKDIISHEAIALAAKIEQMTSIDKGLQSNAQDNLFFSKAELNFDDLPPSDDEAIDMLIDLPSSPIKKDPPKNELDKESSAEPSQTSPKDNIKELESEFIEQKNPEKKAVAATLLLDLKKIVKEDNNPDACKILDDLQKMLGVKSSSNTEILQMYFQNDLPQTVTNSESESNVNDNLPREQSKINAPKKVCQSISESKSSAIEEEKSNHCSSDNHLKVQDNIRKEEGNQIEDSPEDQKLAIDLLHALKNIASDKIEDSAIDVLKSLGTVLSLATELRTKSKEKQIQTTTNQIGKGTPVKLNRSISSLYRSPSSKSQVKPQNKSFEPLPGLRRSLSINPSNNKSLLEVPLAKVKRKSHLLSLKKRFPSDPGFAGPKDKKDKSPTPTEKQPSLAKSPKPKIEPIKTKLKKTTATEAVIRKGPMKAVIPLGNMQKQASSVQKLSSSAQVTPPKTLTIPSLKIISSTPNPNEIRKSFKSSPTASSTPNGSKYRHSLNNQTSVSKTTMSTTNLSPMSLNASVKKSGVVKSAKRPERTVSPQKKAASPRKSVENGGDSKLPRYSPRPVRVRNFSFSETKNPRSPLPPSLAPKGSSEKRIQRNSVSSPLKNFNKVAFKVNPLNLVSRLGKASPIQTGPEKENFA